jgi:8-oxo-dGTP pyrophosphatase MutT (NUDIX family)
MQPTTQPKAAVAIVHTRGPGESVLLIRRAERDEDSWSGHWSFPGGRLELQDPDLLHTALRELEEECGIRLAPEDLEAALPSMVARRQSPPFVLVAPYVFAVPCELPTLLHLAEAVEAVWVRRTCLEDPAQHRLCPVPGRKAEMLYPAIELNGIPLWGFTYRLITDWLRLIPTDLAIEQAGLAAASEVVDLLLARGLKLKHAWEDRREVKSLTIQQVVKVATVEGVIPAAEILAYFSRSNDVIPRVNRIEAQPSYVRVVGLGFEEYLIRAEVPGA